MNHDFAGRATGGGADASAVRLVLRVVNSEYLFWSVKERKGSRRDILYRVKGFEVGEVVVLGIVISTCEAIKSRVALMHGKQNGSNLER